MRLLLLLLLAPSLAAQVRDTTVQDTVPLPPVTVTATRHATSLFAVPLAVTQIKKRDLFGTAGYGLDDALTLVPGVVVQSRYGNQDVRIAIRGYGARGAGDRSNAGTSRGIRVLLDGFPETEPDGRTSFDGIDLAAAQSIEVIRSNASAVWGNAAGGVVSVSTLPEFEDRLAAVEPMAGSFGLQRWALRGGVRVGVEGKLAASFVRSEFDGWREHSGSERSLLNVALVTPVSEHTDLGVYAVGSHNLFRIPGPLTAAQVTADPRQANATYLGRDERRDNLVGRLGVTLDHRLSERADVSALAFVNPKVLHRSERGTFRDFTRYHVGGNTVVRVGSLMIGADFAAQDGAILFYSLTPQGTRGDTLRDDKREGARNAGLFVTEELALGRWTVALGARYDNITYDYQNFLDPKVDARKAFTGLTPKVGVTYRLGPLHSAYAALGGGVEAPAGNETDPASTFGQDTVTAINPLLDPIRSITYEAGTKRTLAFRHGVIRDLSYDVALYQTAVADEIVPYRGGRFYLTAGRVRRRGAELGLRVGAAGGLSLQTALAFADHRYTEYVVDSVHYGAPGAFADYSGNRVVGVPDFTYAVAVELAPAILKPVRLRFAVQGMSSYFADDANQVQVPAYRIATATLGTDEALGIGGGLGVTGFVTVANLFDRHYIGSAFLNPDVVAGEAVAFEPGLPRHVILGFTLTTR